MSEVRGNEIAVELMAELGVTQKSCHKLPTLLSWDQTYTENQLDDVLDRYLPKHSAPLRKSIKDALAIAVYRTQTASPVVKLLMCDDASQFNALTVELALLDT